MQTGPYSTYSTANGITPSDTAPQQYRGVYVGVTGDVTITVQGNKQILFKSVPAGVIIPVETLLVNATGTTATSLVGLA